ncbi:MAG: Hsp20/alpha crystallin family protein [Oscillospiraceae bacterium]|jgi:HSP20 family protein|nr:Hsp20/alpha crystallin family protein [Oscillospiraceae bacterium]MDE6899914.1 Hsp20/alpha crystallin family protein [Oscillospiraceae bacterium]
MFELMPFTRSRGVDLYHPFRDLEELERNLFSSNGAAAFKTDIRDAGDAYVLEADLPGMKKEDIHIDIDGERLSISAERCAVKEEKDENGGYIRCERSYGAFSRSFDISGIRAEEISAAYEDGVLKLTLPKQAKAIPASRRLEIQ